MARSSGRVEERKTSLIMLDRMERVITLGDISSIFPLISQSKYPEDFGGTDSCILGRLCLDSQASTEIFYNSAKVCYF